MADEDATCQRCLEFEDQVQDLQQRLAASGQYVTFSPGPNHGFDVEHELRRWLAVNPRADAAGGVRAGWARLASLVSPRLRDREARWWRAVRANEGLRARVGNLLREVSRLSEPRRAQSSGKYPSAESGLAAHGSHATAWAVKCMPLYDQLELTLELLSGDSYADEQVAEQLPPNVIRFRPRLAQ